MWPADKIAELVRLGFHFDPKLREQVLVTTTSDVVEVEFLTESVTPNGLERAGRIIRFQVIPLEDRC